MLQLVELAAITAYSTETHGNFVHQQTI